MRKKNIKKNITNLQTPPTKIKKRRIFLIALILVFLSCYFDYLLNLNHYKSNFEGIIRKNINADVSISKIRLTFWGGPSINFKNVSIINKSNQSVYFQVDKIKCSISISDIFSNKKIHFTSISLTNPKIRLEKDSYGKFHLPGEKSGNPANAYKSKHSKYTNMLPKIKWLHFDESTFLTDKITASSGMMEISYQNQQGKTLIEGIEIICQRFIDTYSLTIDSQLDDSETSRIMILGTIDISKSKNEKKFKDIIFGSNINLNLSMDMINLSNFSNYFNYGLPDRYKNVKINLSAKANGDINGKTSLTARLCPVNITEKGEINIDIDSSINIKEKKARFNRIITQLDGSEIFADGLYNFEAYSGQLYLFSNELQISTMKLILPFFKNIEMNGHGGLSSVITFYDSVSKPDISGNIYLKEFQGNFKKLSKPVLLTQPCAGSFTKKELIFDPAKVSYGNTPLTLELKYLFLPEHKLYLNIYDLSGLQISDLSPYSSNSLLNVNTNNTNTSQKTIQQSNNNVPDAIVKHNTARRKTPVPIYITASAKNAYFQSAKLGSIYLDALIEDNRMLFKNADIQLYDGNIRGNGVVTFDRESPAVSLVTDLEHIKINDLLTENTSLKNLFYGYLSAAISFQYKGKNINSILESLNSRGTIKIDDGKISNFALIKETLRRFSKDTDDNKLKLLGSSVGLNLPPLEELNFDNDTNFQVLRCDYATSKNKNGRNAAKISALTINSANMNISMAGEADFEKNLDFEGLAVLSEIETTKLLHKIKELSLIFKIENNKMEVPFKIKGTVDNPRPSPIVKISNLHQIMEQVLERKLLKSASATPSSQTPLSPSDNNGNPDNESSVQSYEDKIRKKLKAISDSNDVNVDNDTLNKLDSSSFREYENEIKEKLKELSDKTKIYFDNDSANKLKSTSLNESIDINENDFKKLESISEGNGIKLNQKDMQKIKKIQKKLKKYLEE